MEPEHHIAFGPFRFDVTHGRLYREAQVIGLRPRSLAVLRYLVEHPGRLVTKAEFAAARVGGGARHRERPPRERQGRSGGLGRCGGRAALSGDGWAPGVSVSWGGRPARFPPCHHPGPSWAASVNSTPYRGGSSARPRVTINSSSSVARAGWGRRR